MDFDIFGLSVYIAVRKLSDAHWVLSGQGGLFGLALVTATTPARSGGFLAFAVRCRPQLIHTRPALDPELTLSGRPGSTVGHGVRKPQFGCLLLLCWFGFHI